MASSFGGDIRKYIDSDHLMQIDIEAESDQKRRGLECFKSQVTRFYAWQHHPVLSKDVLDDVCQNPEFFMRYNTSFPGTNIFTKARTWIRLVHLSEPFLKKRKDWVLALLHRMIHHDERKTK